MTEGPAIASIEQNEAWILSEDFNQAFYPQLHYQRDGNGALHRELSILCSFHSVCFPLQMLKYPSIKSLVALVKVSIKCSNYIK